MGRRALRFLLRVRVIRPFKFQTRVPLVFNKRKKIKLLLLIDYGLQVKNNELTIGNDTKKFKIPAANDKFFTCDLNSGNKKEYTRLKDLVNDIDLDILNY